MEKTAQLQAHRIALGWSNQGQLDRKPDGINRLGKNSIRMNLQRQSVRLWASGRCSLLVLVAVLGEGGNKPWHVIKRINFQHLNYY
jgi:hypothetical protein